MPVHPDPTENAPAFVNTDQALIRAGRDQVADVHHLARRLNLHLRAFGELDRLHRAKLHFISGLQDGERPTRDPVLARGFQVTPELFCITTAFQNISVKADDSLHRSRVLVQEFDTQVPGAMRDKARQVLSRGLGHGVEKSISATHIRSERMLRPDPIPKLNGMLITGASAVGLISAGGEEGTVQTELHVEHRNLLMDHNFEPR